MGNGCIDPHFLESALAGVEWSASRPRRFTPGERALGTHWIVVKGGVQLGLLGTTATNSSIVSAQGDYDDGEIGGVIGRVNRSTRRKPAPMLLCPPQTPLAAQTQIRLAAVGSQRLNA
jgi:hypothetical protein